jgi:DNA-binding transcriptional ArsR family regulator
MHTMETTIHLDAAALRVLAHPLRSRLLSQLRLHGPATATELADRLSTHTGATSYHLRKLEQVGLVTDTGEGQGKRRLWRAASRYHSWRSSDFAGDEDAETSLSWLARDYVRHAAEHAQQWLDVEASWPAAWRDALGTSDDVVLVTPEQVTGMLDEIVEVVQRYRAAGEGDPAARRISVWTLLHPVDLDQAPESD